MRILVWQWGRFGAGPLFAAQMAEGLRTVPGVHVALSLSTHSELVRNGIAHCDVPVETYGGVAGWAWQVLRAPFTLSSLVRRFGEQRPDVAVCAMPGPLDLMPLAALRRLRVPVIVLVHDATQHPGDGHRLMQSLQRRLLRRADGVVTLSQYVARCLVAQGMVERSRLRVLWHPPFQFGMGYPPPRSHGGPLRLLFFGRLRAYKGLDLLHAAISRLAPSKEWELRIIGSGEENEVLRSLRRLERVRVENRWVPDADIGGLIGWADAIVLPYVEASQSGIAPAALAAGRYVVATRVGGLPEQLEGAARSRLCEPEAGSLAACLQQLIDAADPPSRADAPARDWPGFADELVGQLATFLPPR